MVVSNDMPQTRLPYSAVAWKNDKFPKGVKDVGILTIQSMHNLVILQNNIVKEKFINRY